jgi:hypothetical protein
MNLIDGIKLKGSPAKIPNSSRDDLPQFFKEMGYKVGAEIGVFKGEFTEQLCKAGFKIFAVDPWLVYKNYRKDPREPSYNEMYENTKKLLAPYDCTIIKKTSIEALDDIPDGSLDFVYIDGNHSLPYITQDIYEWNRKVRPGGAIAGHDYFISRHNPYWIRICHVKYAVDICAKIFGIENFFVLDGKDKHPTWLWIKN